MVRKTGDGSIRGNKMMIMIFQLTKITYYLDFFSFFPKTFQVCCEVTRCHSFLGKPTRKKSAVFLNIVQKAIDPPPLLFEHLSYFAGGVFLQR